MKNSILNLLGGITFLLIAFGIARGTVQEYVHFAGALNEMGCCIMSLFLSIMFFICSVPSKTTK